jgi:pimeloyl-ACP methyl ester carboxylesterase
MGVEIAHLSGPFLTGPGSCVEIVDGAGHFLHLEQPDLVNDIIIGFLT